MATLLTNEAACLIYATVSSLHSIASTLTGEAKGELSSLGNLLDNTSELSREHATALAAGVSRVRDHLLMGPTDDPIGDGNELWDVFLAACVKTGVEKLGSECTFWLAAGKCTLTPVFRPFLRFDEENDSDPFPPGAEQDEANDRGRDVHLGICHLPRGRAVVHT